MTMYGKWYEMVLHLEPKHATNQVDMDRVVTLMEFWPLQSPGPLILVYVDP